MREIKFRAWDEILKKIYYPHEIKLERDKTGKWMLFYEHGNFTPKSIMQYTGLKDKNGKEIYEGDIVKNKGKRLITFWNDMGWGSWWAKPIDSDKPCPETIYIGELEIIGNIYETPELLKQ